MPGRPAAPTLRLERRLLREGADRVGAMDEVGRGAPAGPVHVGLVVVAPRTGRAPAGVRDSKLLTATARRRLAPAIEGWAAASAVASAGPAEVDALGLTGALRLAGQRALAAVDEVPEVVILDGNQDWLTGADGGPRVLTRVRADRTCTSVAAASILAKVTRDAVMVALSADHPAYRWDANKGYGTEEHLAALGRLGATAHHRLTWRLPAPGRAATGAGAPSAGRAPARPGCSA